MNLKVTGLPFVIVMVVVSCALLGFFTFLANNALSDSTLTFSNPNCPSAIHYEHFRKSVSETVDVMLTSTQIKLTDRRAPSYSITLNVRSNGMSFCLNENQLYMFLTFFDGVGQGTGWRNAVAENEKQQAR